MEDKTLNERDRDTERKKIRGQTLKSPVGEESRKKLGSRLMSEDMNQEWIKR